MTTEDFLKSASGNNEKRSLANTRITVNELYEKSPHFHAAVKSVVNGCDPAAIIADLCAIIYERNKTDLESMSYTGFQVKIEQKDH